jgi:hypothetical protein
MWTFLFFIFLLFFKKRHSQDKEIINSHLSQREFTLPAKRLFAFEIEIIVEVVVAQF